MARRRWHSRPRLQVVRRLQGRRAAGGDGVAGRRWYRRLRLQVVLRVRRGERRAGGQGARVDKQGSADGCHKRRRLGHRMAPAWPPQARRGARAQGSRTRASSLTAGRAECARFAGCARCPKPQSLCPPLGRPRARCSPRSRAPSCTSPRGGTEDRWQKSPRAAPAFCHQRSTWTGSSRTLRARTSSA